jgi:general secretion pathway protein G
MSDSMPLVKSLTKGFTLVELLVVMAVLGILTGLLLPLAQTMLLARKEQALKVALVDIRTAIDRFKIASDANKVAGGSINGYPKDLAVLVAGSPQTSALDSVQTGKQHYFLRRIPRDPFADETLTDEQTWGLRSYESPSNNPQKGVDVYDVYSMSTALAMDGTRYRDW